MSDCVSERNRYVEEEGLHEKLLFIIFLFGNFNYTDFVNSEFGLPKLMVTPSFKTLFFYIFLDRIKVFGAKKGMCLYAITINLVTDIRRSVKEIQLQPFKYAQNSPKVNKKTTEN